MPEGPFFISAENNPIIESLVTTERLIQKAEGGERLSADDRRQCIAYLHFSHNHLTNGALAEKFGVSESQIRKDKKIIEANRAKETFETDVSLVVYRVAEIIDIELKSLAASKSKARLGTRDYVLHSKATVEMALSKLQMLVDMGFVQREIPGGSGKKFDYAAIVLKGDQIDTRPVEMFDEDQKKKLTPVQEVVNISPPSPKRDVVFFPAKPAEVLLDIVADPPGE